MSFGDLMAPHASDTKDLADGVRVFSFEGTTGAGTTVPLTGIAPTTAADNNTFEVDDRVGYVEANLTYDDPNSALSVWLVDNWGRVQCGGSQFAPPIDCTAPVPANLTEKAAWSFQIVPGTGGLLGTGTELPNTPYKVAVSLHPKSHMTVGDPAAGTDPGIVMRISDTGVRGSEPNVGYLANGHLFAQEGLATMLSTDDGKTWKDVAPPTTGTASFDPMLRVDPWTGTAYVAQLYIGCSVLAWTTDEGQTWVTNPAACGLPLDDHEKLAVGPGPVPGQNEVYYSFSSFVQGVWASHSETGGALFEPSPVVGVTDGRQPSNTGPIEADRLGNVFIPLYMCDNGGYPGVAVSHDRGLTWAFHAVDPEKGFCSDVDGGIAVDAAGNVYFAYQRPSGVKYAVSTDHGDSWGKPVTVSPGTLQSFVQVDDVAGDAGRLAIAYRATPDTTKGPDASDGWAAWHLYVAFVANATSAQPEVRTALVGGPGDLVQRGAICTTGIACGGDDRNLLDFIDIAVGPDGHVAVVYVDGCKDPCPTPADSRARQGLVALEDTGPSLFAGKAPWAKSATAPAPPGLDASRLP